MILPKIFCITALFYRQKPTFPFAFARKSLGTVLNFKNSSFLFPAIFLENEGFFC